MGPFLYPPHMSTNLFMLDFTRGGPCGADGEGSLAEGSLWAGLPQAQTHVGLLKGLCPPWGRQTQLLH